MPQFWGSPISEAVPGAVACSAVHRKKSFTYYTDFVDSPRTG